MPQARRLTLRGTDFQGWYADAEYDLSHGAISEMGNAWCSLRLPSNATLVSIKVFRSDERLDMTPDVELWKYGVPDDVSPGSVARKVLANVSWIPTNGYASQTATLSPSYKVVDGESYVVNIHEARVYAIEIDYTVPAPE